MKSNVVTTFIAFLAAKDGFTRTETAAHLAAKFSRQYDLQTVYRWESGSTPLPKPVYEYMMGMVIGELDAHNAKDKAALLSFPERK